MTGSHYTDVSMIFMRLKINRIVRECRETFFNTSSKMQY